MNSPLLMHINENIEAIEVDSMDMLGLDALVTESLISSAMQKISHMSNSAMHSQLRKMKSSLDKEIKATKKASSKKSSSKHGISSTAQSVAYGVALSAIIGANVAFRNAVEQSHMPVPVPPHVDPTAWMKVKEFTLSIINHSKDENLQVDHSGILDKLHEFIVSDAGEAGISAAVFMSVIWLLYKFVKQLIKSESS